MRILPGSLRRLAVARRILPVALMLGAGVAPLASGAALTAQNAPPRRQADAGRRPFQHIAHDALPCLGCHGSGARHRVTLVRAPRDCAGCHHDPGRGFECTRCHGPESIPAERQVRLTIRRAVPAGAITRAVTFRHDPHVAAASGVTCRDCHGTDTTLAPNRGCETCHASHHDGRATCERCHGPPPDDAHDATVHLSCASGGCHASERAPAPVAAREVCLFCHAAQREHEPGGSCAACHRIPGAARHGGSGRE